MASDNPATAPAVAPPIPATPPAGDKLKEGVTALLSVSIVACMLVLICCMYADSNPTDPLWAHRSSMLQIVVGFAGTATGYYFGRIPAEKAAANAQQNANTAQANLASASALAQRASDSEQRIRTQVGDLRDHVATPMGGAADGSPDVERATLAAHLDQILRG